MVVSRPDAGSVSSPTLHLDQDGRHRLIGALQSCHYVQYRLLYSWPDMPGGEIPVRQVDNHEVDLSLDFGNFLAAAFPNRNLRDHEAEWPA